MTDRRLPERSGGRDVEPAAVPRTPARRGGAGGLARRGPEPPLHAADHLGLGGRMLRQHWWTLLPPRVADRLTELAGERIEWWAREAVGDRPSAVLAGHTGLCFADPRPQSGYALSCYVLDAGSHRHTDVVHAPDPPAPRAAARRDADGPPPPAAPAPPGLDPAARGMLGNLPPRVQTLLQAPFGVDHPVLRVTWYYEGRPDHLSMFGAVLAGARQVTLVTGTRTIPPGHTEDTAHWSLVCRRADVTRRIGR